MGKPLVVCFAGALVAIGSVLLCADFVAVSGAFFTAAAGVAVGRELARKCHAALALTPPVSEGLDVLVLVVVVLVVLIES